MKPPIPALLPAVLLMGLAACSEPAEPTYEVDATDESGGELIATTPDPDAVPVDTPDVKMTNIPPDATPAAGREEKAPGTE
ncbi:hypothetical protein LY632_04065 [Erythrobacter sp. SDW2]|uniref:hypothetical protein n=1 Tax=Erythrobacter sp. SDW2 TaxID=2907154 RepID=UPI001F4845AE|nr:hypothetical protein [Erythrobacter sp. SDW2]UIP07585.1 hypothetical protein LY632_04065 [Erythrobacter sp. SDW2]